MRKVLLSVALAALIVSAVAVPASAKVRGEIVWSECPEQTYWDGETCVPGVDPEKVRGEIVW